MDAIPEEPDAPHAQAGLWTEKIVQLPVCNTAVDSAEVENKASHLPLQYF